MLHGGPENPVEARSFGSRWASFVIMMMATVPGV
jgi:hypothetical protein